MPPNKKSSKAAQHKPTPKSFDHPLLSAPDEKREIYPGQPINFPEFAEKTYEHQTMLYEKINKLEKHIEQKESEWQRSFFGEYMEDRTQVSTLIVRGRLHV